MTPFTVHSSPFTAWDKLAWLSALALILFLALLGNVVRGIDAAAAKWEARHPVGREVATVTADLTPCTPKNYALTNRVDFRILRIQNDFGEWQNIVTACTRYELVPIPTSRVVAQSEQRGRWEVGSGRGHK